MFGTHLYYGETLKATENAYDQRVCHYSGISSFVRVHNYRRKTIQNSYLFMVKTLELHN